MTKTARRALAAALTAALAMPAFAQEGDPAAGERVFRKCAACHAIEMDGPNKVGPNLHDVVGRTTGTVEGFKYSDAMAQAGEEGHVWTPEELAIYLANPKQAMPGNKMTFPGLKKPEELADVIAYLVSTDPDPTGPVATD
jgi:cytochrome c